MLFSLGRGNVLTWIGIDAFTGHATLGPVLRSLRQSPGSIMVFSRCLIHRLVGLPVEAGVANAVSQPRPPGYPGTQRLAVITNFTFVNTDPKPPRTVARTALVNDYVAYVPPDSSDAAMGFFFGGYIVIVNGPSYIVNDHSINQTCLATKAGSECLALVFAELEAEKKRQAQQQQAEGNKGSSDDSNTTTIVVAVVVPVGTVLLAALVGSIWWVRRSSRRQLEKQQRAKADAAKAAADVEAAGSQQKTGSGGARLGVLAGGVQNNGGGVFLGVDDEQDLPEWSEAAHNESDDLGDMDQQQDTAVAELAGNPEQTADSLTTCTAADDTGTGTGASSRALQQQQQQQQLQLADQSVDPRPRVEVTLESPQQGGLGQTAGAHLECRRGKHTATADGVQQGGPAGLQADAQGGKHADVPAQTGGDRSMNDHSQRASRATNARLKPALTQALADVAVPALVSAGPEGQADKQELTNFALSGSAGGNVEIKVPDSTPSPEEMAAELGALVKELRSNVDHIAIVLEGVLGHGSFGTVYKGTWQGLTVAIKTVVFSANQESRKHALKEAALCQSISHPNIIATYASELQPIGVLPSATTSEQASTSVNTPMAPASGLHAITDWRLYIIQDFADGGPLGNLYGHRALWLSPGVVNLAAVVPLALGIARALAHLHSKRIVHGDLNPNNVLLKRDAAEPSGYAVKVGDFGLSLMLPSDRTHLSNIRMGTMFYICPAVACKGQVGPAADVFSLGVLLWELYHGRRAGIRTQEGPRYCSNFPAFPPTCPEIYKAATLQCLQRQPQNRPPATTVVAALENLLANLNTPVARS
ncbi:hypothetical protein HYH02_009709 [Chlamydomonas schloesseri]|uniref:Protein kinase domain-containing protein n=1 Tax=Chlamydomonas schloesseri TaxID=2026947 RepID=A0A835W7F1_9CHLO|nr:hypothetical protein HYH02_009709 [Chlamydomonas schloesseri]|eukprot:KAG2442225.1 hypothetical protein HYH02_009709 [Chlamydomonas schloesseri]